MLSVALSLADSFATIVDSVVGLITAPIDYLANLSAGEGSV